MLKNDLIKNKMWKGVFEKVIENMSFIHFCGCLEINA